MIGPLIHRWERRLASASTDRVVRPFAWGLDWVGLNGRQAGSDPRLALRAFVDEVMKDTDAFFAVEPAREYGTCTLPPGAKPGERMVTFPSGLVSPHRENNTVYTRYFPAHPGPRPDGLAAPRRGVVVLPQWNADEDGHVGLCRLLNRVGISALRLTLPYHDRRMPPELTRADFIVSANLGQTLQACQQAVLDARRAVAWLAAQGYERIGLLGTSLGSCLSMLTGAHEPIVRVMALNHVSPWFADVVWEGLSTAHVREGLEGRIQLPLLRELWRPISPWSHLDRVRGKKTLLVYALFDLSFPLHLSRDLVREYARRGIPHETRVLPCGHYTTGVAPFKYLDGYYLASFLKREL